MARTRFTLKKAPEIKAFSALNVRCCAAVWQSPPSACVGWSSRIPGSISAGRIAQCIRSRSGRTCPCCQVADLQRGLWLDAGGLPPLPAHAGRWDSTRPAGRRQRRCRTGGRYGASQQRPCDHPSSSFSFAKFSALGLTLPLSQREITA